MVSSSLQNELPEETAPSLLIFGALTENAEKMCDLVIDIRPWRLEFQLYLLLAAPGSCYPLVGGEIRQKLLLNQQHVVISWVNPERM